MNSPLIVDLAGAHVFPSIDVQLPTLGNFYFPEDGIFEEGFDPTKVKVSPLGLAHELSIKDPLMVMSRQSTPLLVKTLCPSIVRPEMLSEVDMVAIILAGRIASYGPKYRIDHVCQNPATTIATKKGEKVQLVCSNARDNKASTIDIDLYAHIQRYQPYTDWDQFIVDIPEVKQRVVIRPTSYQSFLKRLKIDLEQNKIMNRYRDTDVSDFLVDDDMVQTYKSVLENSTRMGIDQIVDSIFYIESVEKDIREGDRDVITQWIESVPVPIAERVIKRIAEIRDDIANRAMIDYKCEVCGHVNRVMIELDAERLFSSGSQGTPEPLALPVESPKQEIPTPIPSEPKITTPPSGNSSGPKRRTATPKSRIFTR